MNYIVEIAFEIMSNANGNAFIPVSADNAEAAAITAVAIAEEIDTVAGVVEVKVDVQAIEYGERAPAAGFKSNMPEEG